MMCDECGIRPAQFHLTTISGEEKTERNLCPVCMAKYQKQLPGIDFSNLAGILNNILDGGREYAVDFRLWFQSTRAGGGLIYVPGV